MCHVCFRLGDYHLGRSCRLLPQEDYILASNVSCETSLVSLLEQPIPKRIFSLVGQTSQILVEKATNSVLSIPAVGRLQNDVCEELWEIMHTFDCGDDEAPLRTIPERLLCGRIERKECTTETTGHQR